MKRSLSRNGLSVGEKVKLSAEGLKWLRSNRTRGHSEETRGKVVGIPYNPFHIRIQREGLKEKEYYQVSFWEKAED